MPNLSHLWPASDTTSTTRSLCGQKPATSDRYPTPICAHPRLQRPRVGGRGPRQHPQRRFRSATASHGGRARTTAAPAEAVSRDSSGSNGVAAPREGAAPRTTAVMAAMTAMTAMAAIPATTRTAANSLPLPPPPPRIAAMPDRGCRRCSPARTTRASRSRTTAPLARWRCADAPCRIGCPATPRARRRASSRQPGPVRERRMVHRRCVGTRSR